MFSVHLAAPQMQREAYICTIWRKQHWLLLCHWILLLLHVYRWSRAMWMSIYNSLVTMQLTACAMLTTWCSCWEENYDWASWEQAVGLVKTKTAFGIGLLFSFWSHSPLAWLNSVLTAFPNINHGENPPLAVRDSQSVGTGICNGWPCPFPPEKLDTLVKYVLIE